MTGDQLGVGMYVITTGESRGRIVDRREKAGVVQWLVKLLPYGGILWMSDKHCRPA